LKCETSSGFTEEKFEEELLGEVVELHRGAATEVPMMRREGGGMADDNTGRRPDRARLRSRAPAGRDGAGMVGG
jgi:hypothetical protein